MSDWLNFAAALSWPVVVIVVTLIFRNPLSKMIDRIKSAEVEVPGGTKIKLALLARDAEQLIPQLVDSPSVRELAVAPTSLSVLQSSVDSETARATNVGQLIAEVRAALVDYLERTGSGTAVRSLSLPSLVGLAMAGDNLSGATAEALGVFSSLAQEFQDVPGAVMTDDAYIAFAQIAKALIARLGDDDAADNG